MVQLKIEDTTILLQQGSSETVKTSFLIDYALNFPVRDQKGFNSEDIFKRVRIKQALKDIKEGEDILYLEDADAINLQKIVSEVEWFAPHEDIAKFITSVNELPVKITSIKK